jgi:hypothetical protein
VQAWLRTMFRRFPIRSVDMTRLLDTVLLCAVATILFIRLDLWLTNYPQLGGHGLHIANLLWGGLLTLIAIGLMLAFVSPGARKAAAVVGGIGLGLFIDELGKFVTSDNNYFFKPTAAITTASSSSASWSSVSSTGGGRTPSASASSTRSSS